ncbi:MAG: DUF2027 domain-containing protein [Candidatus Amulumruptor caecigallinarius]|nr:DUF2027 domain-containing protein [Candidatus Amulumruptor caecigallinarius]MCM1397410.1 DUF2027 domain-containing protein [Candidatus Amulumruptor caecigallinarius]MCM1454495.1 DUF2027 domain-containing protein [bacterium]
MATVKTGDSVRFLNSTGGGRVARVEGRMAYVVDEDGFETPVLTGELVVVASAADTEARIAGTMPADSAIPRPMAAAAPKAPATPSKEIPSPFAPAFAPSIPPIEETDYGDKLNVVLAYEPHDIKAISTTPFDAYLVNDSNYYLSVAYMLSEDGSDWELIAQTVIEPNTQALLDEVDRAKLARMSHIALQFVAFKVDRAFRSKMPVWFERKLDLTKFFKLHSFKANTYFDSDVLALDIVIDDRPAIPQESAPVEELRKALIQKQREKPARRPVTRRPKKSVRERDGILEVDLHINELLDNTIGMSPADILNYQIDTFRRVMDENASAHGRKIVFIHGKGDGILRNALTKELAHRYKMHSVQDASFREYGFGATQVTIR